MAPLTASPAYLAARILAGLIGRPWCRQHKPRHMMILVGSGVGGLMGSLGIYKAPRTRANGILAMPSPPVFLLSKAGHPRGQIDVLGVFWRLGVCRY